MKLLRPVLALLLAHAAVFLALLTAFSLPPTASAQPTPTPTNTSLTVNATTSAITAPGNATRFASANGLPTLSGSSTFLTGATATFNSGSTLTLNGALAGTPTGGTLSLANLTLTAPAALTAGTLVLSSAYTISTMGDSLTAGGNYQTRLLTHLTGWQILNYGISGTTTAGMSSRLSSNITSRNNANYLIIWGGINDVVAGTSAATIQSNLQAMYTAGQAAGAKVIAIKISPFKTNADWSAPRQTVLDAVNAWISATATGVDHVVDAYTLLEDPGAADTLLAAYDSGDHLHLSTAGYNAVGDAINSAVGTWTATKPADPSLRLGAGTATTLRGAGAGSLLTDAQLTITDATDASQDFVGSLTTRGGATIAKSARVGASLTVGSALTVNGSENSVGIGTGTLQLPAGGAYIGGNIISGGLLSVVGSIGSGGTIASGNVFTAAGVGGVFTATTAGTDARYLRVGNTGGNFYFGNESSSAGGFFTGSAAYDTVLYSPGNDVYLRTPNVKISGLLKTGTTPTTLTDSAGKILSAALNTVAVAQGGTGLTSLTTNGLAQATSTSAMQSTLTPAGLTSLGVATIAAPAATDLALQAGTGVIKFDAALPFARLSASTTGSPYGLDFYNGTTYEASLRHQISTAALTLDVGRNASWGGKFDLYADTTRVLRATKTTLTLDGNVTVGGTLALSNTVNTVSPTSPNRTITIVINGTTYYLHAKTTND